jgi:predicted metal-dependent HD superfamily phosphohydrolase
MLTEILLDRWKIMWEKLGISSYNTSLLDRLIGCYGEAHRHYHTMQHIEECLLQLSEYRSNALSPQEIELAIWFHDAIYDVKSQNNEEKSANWARSVVLKVGLSSTIADRVYAAILATKHDRISQDNDVYEERARENIQRSIDLLMTND